MREAAKSGMNGVETVLRTSVAMLYSNLVTRPTGRAVRGAIEKQIEETRGPCLSILDFSHVGVIDFSCADEVIAKLLVKYRSPDRPSEAFFVVQGASEHHRDLIESVLQRYNLLLVALDSEQPVLWGSAPTRLRRAWEHLDELGRAEPGEFASTRGMSALAAGSWLRRLVNWRVAIPEGREHFSSLPANMDSGADAGRGGPLPVV
jgi:hypothetical protein